MQDKYIAISSIIFRFPWIGITEFKSCHLIRPISFAVVFEEIIFHPISVFPFYLSKYENTEKTDTNEA